MSDALYLFLKTSRNSIFFFAENFILLNLRSDCNCMLEQSMIATLKSFFNFNMCVILALSIFQLSFLIAVEILPVLDMMSNFALSSGHSRLWDSSSYLNLLLQYAGNSLKFRIHVLALRCELQFKCQFSFQSLRSSI